MSEKIENTSVIDRIELKEAVMPIASEEINTKDGFIKWGEDNLYPQWLNWLFNNNAIHSGIIRSKVIYTVSGGLTYEGPDQEAWKAFFSNGKSDYDLDEIVEKLSLDFELSNRFIIRGTRNKKTGVCEKLEWIDYETARSSLDGSTLMVSKDWSNEKVKVKLYDPLDLSGNQRQFYLLYEEQPKQALLNKPDAYSPKTKAQRAASSSRSKEKLSKGVYPSPPYSGGLKAISTGIEIDEYQLSEIVNGFSLGTVVSLNSGKPAKQEDRDKITGEFKNNGTGSSNAGGVIILYANGKEQAATIQSLNGNNLNERYQNVEKGAIKKTLHSHSITTPILFGVKEEGSLGNATELRIGYEVMKRNYFNKRQKALLTALNYIGQKCNGLRGEISFNDVVLDLDDSQEEKPAAQEVVLKVENEKVKTESDLLLFALSEKGENINKSNVLYSVPVDNSNIQDQEVIDRFLKENFNTISEVQMKTLVLIQDKAEAETIKKALKLTTKELADIYAKLQAVGYLDDTGKLTRTGIIAAAKSDVSKIGVVYSYELRKDAPKLEPGGETRHFCQTLLDLNRFYTRDDINTISARQGYNVFAFKGGWYHNKNTGKNEPSCRHTWVSNIVLK